MTPEQFHALLQLGVQHRASDIHFRPGGPPTYRVNGVLAPLKGDKLTAEATLALCRLVVRDPATRERLETLHEYDGSYSLPGVARYRVHIYRQRGTLSLVLRIISHEVPTIDTLALPPVIKTIAETERGLVLVTGATGSGKTTTLAAMINHVNHTRRVHILTLEDPIEYLFPNALASVSQREIGIDTPDYASALRAALRQDPDVMLLGEIRDAESVDIALKAAETGHAVFGTVHTTDVAKTIGRLVALFPAEEQASARLRLADNLRAVVSQRLLPRADGKGRVLAAEIMIATQTVQDYIREESKAGSLRDIIEAGRRHYGMQTFDQHLTDLYKSGQISLKVAIKASSSPADFQRSLDFDT